MQTLILEINDFLSNSTYSNNTKRNYRYKLLNFSEELEIYSDIPLKDLHLQRIYEVRDINGIFITYRSIDVPLMDQYFRSQLHRGYYCLKDNKDALGAFFNYLNRNYDFPNIMKELNFDVSYYKPKNKRVPILSNHDILKFFHYIVSNNYNRVRDTLLFTLFLTTGCRSSEIVNLKIKDFYWEDEKVFLPQTKHNKSNMVPLRLGLAESIKDYCIKYNLREHDNLFNLNQTQIRELFYDCLAQANLPKVTLHSLRHSFATMMVNAGAAITEVQQLLNHADVITTKGYVQPNLTSNKNINIKENDEIYRSLSKLLKL